MMYLMRDVLITAFVSAGVITTVSGIRMEHPSMVVTGLGLVATIYGMRLACNVIDKASVN